MKIENIVNKIVDKLFEEGLTIEDVDISEYEQAITNALKEIK